MERKLDALILCKATKFKYVTARKQKYIS